MKDYIIRQAYDKGYDAGVRAHHEAKYVAVNPYKKARGWGYSRYDYWQMGCDDGWKGKPRKMTPDEANDKAWAIVRRVAAMDGMVCLCRAGEHGADCLVGQARAIVGTPETATESEATA